MKLFFTAALATLFLATTAFAGPIAIKVTADNGGPVAGLSVKAEAVPFERARAKVTTPFKANGMTGSDGVASFNVPDGQVYEISVTYMGQVYARHANPGAGTPIPIVVPASKVVNQAFFIRTTQSQAVSGATITISQNNKTVTKVTADGNGAVNVPLLAGSYSIQVNGNGKTVTQNVQVTKPPHLIEVNIDAQGRPGGPVKALKR
jgi:uncharacterized membrane protein